MLADERIRQYVQRLPQALQAEVLDFVEYLVAKVERETARHDDTDWTTLSLAYAMRGMEDEDDAIYTPADVKVVFS